MVLVIDIGNSNVKMGLYEGSRLLDSWRLGTSPKRTSDEYGMLTCDVFRTKGYSTDGVEGIVISSVIPGLNYSFERLCEYYFKRKPMFVEPGIKTGISIKYDNPRELGADRIVCALAAYKLYKAPLVAIDFGTATTFNVVNERGEFLGGVIMSGIKTSAEALISGTAKLQKFELDLPPRIVGRNSVANMQSGAVYGTIGAVEYILKGIKAENGWKEMTVVATGGLSELIKRGTDVIDVIDRTLALTGLKIIYDINNFKRITNNE